MPHCVVEYSKNIIDPPDKKTILKNINLALAETGLFSINDIKSRIIVHDDFVVGDGDPARAFVTLNLSILSGRDNETKKKLSDICLNLLKKYFSESFQNMKMSLTVQISELDKNSYGRLKSY